MRKTKCQCGFELPEDQFPAHVRSAVVRFAGQEKSIADVGFRCPQCHLDFGFELLTDAFLTVAGFEFVNQGASS